jgi:Adenylate and Guanylate cyclase catalytic domain
MNTAARMEGSGLKGRIQISQDTADCLVELGKENWFTPRTDMKVVAKGIGEIKTYWLCLGSDSDFGLSPLPSTSRAPSEREADITHVSNIELVDEARALSISSEKVSRLIDWNVDTLLHSLKRIVASRKLQGKPGYRTERTAPYEQEFGSVGLTSVVEEVKEVIPLPQKDALGALNDGMIDSISLPPEVVEQLYAFVTSIAALYNANPFHSFEHASHVTMSVVKLLSRIVAPNLVDMIGKTLHDHTYGITSDPLTQFACVFSALIHDGTLEPSKEWSLLVR